MNMFCFEGCIFLKPIQSILIMANNKNCAKPLLLNGMAWTFLATFRFSQLLIDSRWIKHGVLCKKKLKITLKLVPIVISPNVY